jgi:hypothetical protein
MINVTETITPLAANATFTGPARKINRSPGTVIFDAYFYSDQVSATNGAKVEGSDDGVSWELIKESSVVALQPLLLEVPVIFNYIRVVLINGAVNQTDLMVRSSINSI